MISKALNLQLADAHARTKLNALLRSEALPVITRSSPHDSYWVIFQHDEVVAGIGLEQYDQFGLLRSLVTHSDYRGQGLATTLLNALLQYAEEQGLKEIYLLTETAAKWFLKKGFVEAVRHEAPAPIMQSEEFLTLCPASAALMKKKI